MSLSPKSLLIPSYWRLSVTSANSSVPILLIPRRGGKQKWGGITRDPYKTFQKRLDRQRIYEQSKVPLKSEERALRDMDYPLNFQSLGGFFFSFMYVC